MPMIEYRYKKFSAEHQAIIVLANEIIRGHRAQGYTLTLRQIYYQFIRRDYFPNTEQSYKRLGSIINDARLAGLIDWNAIEDRSRSIARNPQWESPADILGVLEHSYHIDMWQNQGDRPEVWVEKDALVGIVAAACQPLDVTYFACRGYVSQSEQWVSSQRLQRYVDRGQTPVVFYLGDHDPSGIDMTRDHNDRLAMFMGGVRVERLALNYDQVQHYAPPPNPTKLSDSRATGYVANFGHECWELDALEPAVIVELIRNAILGVRDTAAWHRMEAKKEIEKDNLKGAVEVARAHLGRGKGIA